ncbi:L-rhamnose-binding lectin SML-like [Oryzias latipes]
MPTERVTTCVDGVVHRLSCELGGVISVQTSLSGGEDSVACSEGGKAEEVSSTGCSDMAVVDIVKKYTFSHTQLATEKESLFPVDVMGCNGKNSCIIKAGNSEFGDPCVGTFNHLEVAYTCNCN